MLYLLRVIHIVGGVFWVGAAMFATYLLMPSLGAAGPAAGPVMTQLTQVRKMPFVMMTLGLLTLGAGIWLLIIDSASSPGVWMRSGPGQTFAIGGVLAILGFVLGVAINIPASRRLGAIAESAAKRGGPPSPEELAAIQQVQRRMAVGNQIVTGLLVLAASAMAVARYVT